MGLESVEIVMEAERLFNIALPDDKVEHIHTFGTFVDCVNETCLAKGYKLDRLEIVETLRKMVSVHLGVPECKISNESRFIEDLGMN